MRISMLLLLSCLAASPALAQAPSGAPRTARLLPLASTSTGQDNGASLEMQRRPSKVLQGVLVTVGTGLLVPAVSFPLLLSGGGILGPLSSSTVLYGGILLGSCVLTPVLVHWVMDGAPLGGRVALGALLGAGAGLLLGVALSPGLGLLSLGLALVGPGLGAVVAIESARQAGLYDGDPASDDDARLGGWARPSPAVAFRF